jgi:hypothetical protein
MRSIGCSHGSYSFSIECIPDHLLVIVDSLSRVVAPKGGDSIFLLDWWVLKFGEDYLLLCWLLYENFREGSWNTSIKTSSAYTEYLITLLVII